MAKKKMKSSITPMQMYDHDTQETDIIYGDMFDDEAMINIFAKVGNVYDAQCRAAIDLTRIIVEHNEKNTLTEDKILATYHRAVGTVTQDSPMKELLDEIKQA